MFDEVIFRVFGEGKKFTIFGNTESSNDMRKVILAFTTQIYWIILLGDT